MANNIFRIAIEKGELVREAASIDHILWKGEIYKLICSNDINAISVHINRMEMIIEELLTQLDKEREKI